MKLLFPFQVFTLFSLCLPLIALPIQAEDKPAKKPLAVIGYQVQQESIAQTLDVLGKLQAQQSIDLMANVTETVESLHFKDGQMVKQGQLLVELNAQEEQAQLQQADVLIAEAKRQYDRANQIKDRGAITESVIDERFRQWQSAKAERKIIEARLADRRLHAPFSGQLGFRLISQGALVTPGTKITTLDDISEMQVDIQIPSRYLAEIHLGQKIQLTTPAYPQTFIGEVIALAPRVESDTRQIQLRASVPNPKGLLKSGMLVNTQITLPDRKALTLPTSAILMLGEKQFIYRLTAEENAYRVSKVPVVTGTRYADRVEILSGIQVDDLIVSQGIMKLAPKKRVILKGLENQKSQTELLHGKVLKAPEAKE